MNTKILLNNIADKTEKSLIEIYTLRNEKAELETDYRKLAEELHQANNQLQRNVIEIGSLKKINTDFEIELAQLKAEVAKLTNKLTSLSDDLKNKNAEIVQLSKNLEEIKKINADIEAKNADLLNESESGKIVIKEYEIEIQRMKELFEQKKKIVTKKKIK